MHILKGSSTPDTFHGIQEELIIAITTIIVTILKHLLLKC